MSTRKHNKKRHTKQNKTKKNKSKKFIREACSPKKKWRSIALYLLYSRVFT